MFSHKPITGIYIGIKKIAVAQVSRSIKGLQLDKVAESNIFLKNKSVNDSSFNSSPNFEMNDRKSPYINALKDLLTEYNFQTENIILTIPSKEAMVRYFTLPRVGKSEISSTIRFEAKKYIPFNLDEMDSDYHIIYPGSSKEEMEVLFAAAKMDLIQKYLSILNQCNLTPISIRIPSLSLLNIVYNYQASIGSKKSGCCALIDFNEGIATITIFKNGIPYLIRDFSLARAESPGARITDEDYENFLHEFHLSLEYYYGQFPDHSINEIFLFDDGTLKDKVSNLSSEFNTTITQPNLSQIIKGEKIENISSQAILAISTAADGHLKPKVDLSLLPSEEGIPTPEVVSGKPSVFPRIIVIEFVTLVIGMLILYIILGRKMMFTLQDQIDRVKQDRARVSPSLVGLSKNDLMGKLEQTIKKKNILSSLIEKRVYLTDKFNKLIIDLPKGVWFERLDFQDKIQDMGKENFKMNIAGMVFLEYEEDVMDIINRFLRDLKNDPAFMEGFSRVELSSVRKDKIRGFLVTYFRLKCY